MFVGMPAALLLDEFGSQIYAAFGEWPYLVGSSMKSKQWRDVDVRLILPDEQYESLGLGDPRYSHHNAKWVSLTLAYAALGKAMTGLPIDFQIQQQSDANKQYGSKDHPRGALGFTPLRIGKYFENMAVNKGLTINEFRESIGYPRIEAMGETME